MIYIAIPTEAIEICLGVWALLLLYLGRLAWIGHKEFNATYRRPIMKQPPESVLTDQYTAKLIRQNNVPVSSLDEHEEKIS